MTENENIRMADESLDNAISVYKTTIKVVEESKDSDYCPILDKVTVALLEELKSYREIGTIEEFKALKEKNEPKEMDRYYCPICRHYFEDGEAHNYCHECGQALEI